jgi:hypothetical protein
MERAALVFHAQRLTDGRHNAVSHLRRFDLLKGTHTRAMILSPLCFPLGTMNEDLFSITVLSDPQPIQWNHQAICRLAARQYDLPARRGAEFRRAGFGSACIGDVGGESGGQAASVGLSERNKLT